MTLNDAPLPPDSKRRILRRICDESHHQFANLMHRWTFVGKKDEFAPFPDYIHGVVSKKFQDPAVTRGAGFFPRNWAKSTYFTQWGAIWDYLKEPAIPILLASQNEPLAERFLGFIKRQLRHHRLLRWIYADILEALNDAWIKDPEHKWTGSEILLPGLSDGIKEASITSVGIGSAAQSGHYGKIFIDDPVGKKHLESPTEMERIYQWQDNVPELLINPNHDTLGASRVWISCTFWFAGDYGSYIAEKYPEYKFFVVPGLKDEELESTDNFTYIQDPHVGQDESNWGNAPGGRSSTAYYHEMRANPEKELIFWAQIQNQPHKASMLTKFEQSWIHWYRLEDRADGKYVVCKDDKEEFRIGQILLYGGIDPGGFSEKKVIKKGSRNAMLIGGQPRNSVKKFVFHAWAERFKEPSYFMDALFDAHKKWEPRLWEIDSTTAQYIYRDILEERRKRGIALKIGEFPQDKTKDSKDTDIQALIDPMFNGEIYLHDSMKLLIGEIKTYPNGLTVDLLDMLAKINRYHWSRRSREDMAKKKPGQEWRDLESINPFTGY